MVDQKECKVCASTIHAKASKCIHCNSFQNYRRYLSVSTTFLGLLVALVGIISASTPIYYKYIIGLNSDIKPHAVINDIGVSYDYVVLDNKLEWTRILDMKIDLIATNSGLKYGIINEVYLSDYSSSFEQSLQKHTITKEGNFPFARNTSLLRAGVLVNTELPFLETIYISDTTKFYTSLDLLPSNQGVSVSGGSGDTPLPDDQKLNITWSLTDYKGNQNSFLEIKESIPRRNFSIPPLQLLE